MENIKEGFVNNPPKNYIKVISGEFSEAIAYFNNEIEKNPNNEHAYFYQGEVYLKSKEYKNAIKSINKVIELNPKYPNIYQRHTDIMMILSSDIPLTNTLLNYGAIATELNQLMSQIKPEKTHYPHSTPSKKPSTSQIDALSDIRVRTSLEDTYEEKQSQYDKLLNNPIAHW